MDRNFYN